MTYNKVYEIFMTYRRIRLQSYVTVLLLEARGRVASPTTSDLPPVLHTLHTTALRWEIGFIQ